MRRAAACSTSGDDARAERPLSYGSPGPISTRRPETRVPQLILTVLLVAIGWFLLIRPQQVRIREQRAMVETLEVGDRVVTAGGIHGVIRGLAAETVQVEVAAGVEVTVARPAIMRRLDPDTSPDAVPGTEDDVTSASPEVAPGDEPSEDA